MMPVVLTELTLEAGEPNLRTRILTITATDAVVTIGSSIAVTRFDIVARIYDICQAHSKAISDGQ